ncbi:MAG: hypothetical protein ABIH34_03165 [Nanoarchaeota archaeon]
MRLFWKKERETPEGAVPDDIPSLRPSDRAPDEIPSGPPILNHMPGHDEYTELTRLVAGFSRQAFERIESAPAHPAQALLPLREAEQEWHRLKQETLALQKDLQQKQDILRSKEQEIQQKSAELKEYVKGRESILHFLKKTEEDI